MTKSAALHQFFSSFGIDAYEAASVLDENGGPDVKFPYLTYEMTLGAFEDTTFPTVNLWYRSEKNTEINAKAQEILDACHNGAPVRFDGGGAIVYCGGWQALGDEADRSIKRRYSNFTIHWVSNT